MCREVAKLHVTGAGSGQAFLVASGFDSAGVAYGKIADALTRARMEIVHERIFGSLSVERDVVEERQAALGARGITVDTPVTYIQGHPPSGEGLGGVIIHAVSSGTATPADAAHGDVWTIRDRGTPCGRGWRKNGVEYLILQDVQAAPGAGPTPEEQAGGAIDCAERLLHQQGATYRDVVRTWFYLSDILDWYDEFNRVRNGRYQKFGIMPGPGTRRLSLPASTGIGGDNPPGTRVAMDLLAMVGYGDAPAGVKQMSNIGQEDAFQYGSAFSRGALIPERDVSIIQLSGTAAIDEAGESLYRGDDRAQIICTLDKIETLISQEGAGLQDVCAATVFVKRPEAAEIFGEVMVSRGLPDFPGVCVVADVCREELLFEMDAEVAVSPHAGS